MTGPAAVRGAILRVDGTACDGHGICLLRLPELVSLDEWGYAEVRRDPITDEVTLRRARRAVRACPKGALSLEAPSVRAPSPGT